MPPTAHRLKGLTESVIREMTRVADEAGAINLSQGFPDFDPPEALVEAAVQALRDGYHQYAVTWGAPAFRQALADKQRKFMGVELDADAHITVTCGSTEAMMTAMMTVCNPGDKVVVFSPFYENYGADTILAGADPIFVPLHAPDFEFDPQELETAFRQGARALVLCNPGNPTGRVFRREELQTIADLAQAYDAFVITDEVYEHIVYEPHKHTYIAAMPGMFERTLSCSSLSKTYAVTGWRLGYLIAPEAVTRQARKVHDFLTVGAPAPLQEAAVTALRFPPTYYEVLQRSYAARRDVFLAYLDRAGLQHTVPEGAYYVMVDIEAFGAESDTAFCRWLAREVGVAAVPGSSFYGEAVQRWVRFHFAKKQETLRAAGERLLGLRSRA